MYLSLYHIVNKQLIYMYGLRSPDIINQIKQILLKKNHPPEKCIFCCYLVVALTHRCDQVCQ